MSSVHLAATDLNLLVVLDTLLQCRSTVECGRRLGRTQSAISHALARLRAHFADPLLVRSSAGLTPTPFAEQLAAPLAEALTGVSAVVAAPSAFDPSQLVRSFTIAGTDLAELVVLPRLLARLSREAPGVTLRTVFVGEQVERALREGAVDLALGARFVAAPSLVVQNLFDETFVSMARRGHRILRGKVTLARFVAAEHALVAPRGAHGSFVDDALAARGLSRKVVVRTPYFTTAALLAATSDLVVTLPSRFARAVSPSLPLGRFTPPLAVAGFTFAQAFARSRSRDPAHAWLRACVTWACRPAGRQSAASPTLQQPRGKT